MDMNEKHLNSAQKIAAKITKSLEGSGIWGVEFLYQKMVLFFLNYLQDLTTQVWLL